MYLAIKWAKVGERPDCLDLLTKHSDIQGRSFGKSCSCNIFSGSIWSETVLKWLKEF